MITINNLSVRFKGDVSIRYRDLTFEAGHSYALLGASGCGKTTLLNMLAGVLTPTTGSIDFDGTRMSAQSQHARDKFRIQHIGYIFQDFKLLEEMTVQDNIGILRLEGVDLNGMDAMLEELGILALKKRKTAKLSGGEKQRVAIARALIKRPTLVLADEPTGNLNYETGRAVVEQLVAATKGGTLIVVTHDDRLAELFDHVIDMNGVTSFETEVQRNA